jgi:hypothetical protein
VSLATQIDNYLRLGRAKCAMNANVAGRAQHITLLNLDQQSRPWSSPATNGEYFGSVIAVMEMKVPLAATTFATPQPDAIEKVCLADTADDTKMIAFSKNITFRFVESPLPIAKRILIPRVIATLRLLSTTNMFVLPARVSLTTAGTADAIAAWMGSQVLARKRMPAFAVGLLAAPMHGQIE